MFLIGSKLHSFINIQSYISQNDIIYIIVNEIDIGNTIDDHLQQIGYTVEIVLVVFVFTMGFEFLIW